MIRSTRRLAAVGALALIAALGTGATSAQAAPPPGQPVYVDGWVALSTGSTNTVTWSGGTASQTLTSDQSCAMTSDGADLLSFAAEPPVAGLTPTQSVGLNSGAIGVRESLNANGTSCSAVDASSGERLTLALGSTVGSDLAAVSASLDMDLKQNAAITAEASLGGDVTGTFRLQSGNTIVKADEGDPTVTQCNMPADSGPDAKTGNNCRWLINAAFDTLTLKADSGSFSLMGGADGAVPGLPDYLTKTSPAGYGIPAGASVLELASRSRILPCDDTTKDTITGGTVKSSVWKNVDGEGCAPYPYAASVVSSASKWAVHFVKPTWAAGTSEWTTTFSYTSKVPVLEFAFDAEVPSFFKPVDCTFSSGAVVVPPGTSGNYACIQSTTVDKKNKTATFTVFVLGDAWMRG